MPCFIGNSPKDVQAISLQQLEADVEFLSVACHPRSIAHPENQQKAVAFIADRFNANGAQVSYQHYTTPCAQKCVNVLALFPGKDTAQTLIVGAHYDSFDNTPGADDNASGVVGLLALSQLLKTAPLQYNVLLIAYNTEEPPYFATDSMGSYVHAHSITAKDTIIGMICLEMMGRFSKVAGTQEYPTDWMKLFYPDHSHWLALIGDFRAPRFSYAVKCAMIGATSLPVYSVSLPANTEVLNFSDHRNYWMFDIPAVMVTNTAFYRNADYHTEDDTHDRLSYDTMREAIIMAFAAIQELAGAQ